ncbi:hypothetical protein BDQ17DRAFT_1371212, partial [Cyathus striatus]
MASASMFANELGNAYDVPVSHCQFITKYVNGVNKTFSIEICYSPPANTLQPISPIVHLLEGV